jgi:hypothetical protein
MCIFYISYLGYGKIIGTNSCLVQKKSPIKKVIDNAKIITAKMILIIAIFVWVEAFNIVKKLEKATLALKIRRNAKT